MLISDTFNPVIHGVPWLQNRPPAKVFARSFNINHFKDYLLIIKDWSNVPTTIGSVDLFRTFAGGLLSQEIGTTCIPAMTALAGLVPWADWGMRQTLRSTSPRWW